MDICAQNRNIAMIIAQALKTNVAVGTVSVVTKMCCWSAVESSVVWRCLSEWSFGRYMFDKDVSSHSLYIIVWLCHWEGTRLCILACSVHMAQVECVELKESYMTKPEVSGGSSMRAFLGKKCSL